MHVTFPACKKWYHQHCLLSRKTQNTPTSSRATPNLLSSLRVSGLELLDDPNRPKTLIKPVSNPGTASPAGDQSQHNEVPVILGAPESELESTFDYAITIAAVRKVAEGSIMRGTKSIGIVGEMQMVVESRGILRDWPALIDMEGEEGEGEADLKRDERLMGILAAWWSLYGDEEEPNDDHEGHEEGGAVSMKKNGKAKGKSKRIGRGKSTRLSGAGKGVEEHGADTSNKGVERVVWFCPGCNGVI
jgi:hypothetical protein